MALLQRGRHDSDYYAMVPHFLKPSERNRTTLFQTLNNHIFPQKVYFGLNLSSTVDGAIRLIQIRTKRFARRS